MKYIGSSIGVNDEVLLNDINYFSIGGPSFTPGVGGTYKQPAPPALTNEVEVDEPEDNVGCELARSAGWGTPSWCSEKTVTCNLDRPLEPQRHIDPGRLDYLTCKLKERIAKQNMKTNGTYAMFVVIFLFILFLCSVTPRK